jgi:guanylate kinase
MILKKWDFSVQKNLSGNPISNTAEIKRENEIDIKEYTSIQDKDFHKIEHINNFLHYIIFTAYS